MKKILILLFILTCTCIDTIANDFVVVIDPGHGGRDPGAVRGKIQEKNINLAVATYLGRLIENNHPDVKVIYTRKTDVFLDLNKRAEIANKVKANLFISVHTNSTSAKTTYVSGPDTYTLGLGRSSENLEVAKRENSVILYEDNYKQKYENFDPNSPESYIIFEFMVSKYLEQSIDLATHIQHGFKNIAKRVDRGVNQAGFLVLRETAMPSVLIELGFINNPDEARFLSTDAGQQIMAKAIYSGFNKYKNNFDKKQGYSISKSHNVSDSSKAETYQEIQTNDVEPVEQTVQPAYTEQSTLAHKTEKTTPAVIDKKTTELVNPKNNAVEYKIQILTSPIVLPKKSPKFKGLSPVSYYKENNTYKYTYGSTTNQDEASKLLKHVKSKFKDAFIIQFRDGKRIK